ncbi:MAG: ABC transporter permease [Anaerolineae bacterium]
MKWLRYLRTSVESLTAHKTRSILTMLGIIIGVAAVLTTVGIGRGAAANITERIQSQGTNLLTVYPGAAVSGGVRQAGGSAQTLTMGDARAIADQAYHPSVARVAPEYTSSAQLATGSSNSQSQVVGTVPDYAIIRNLSVASGRFLTAEDVEQQRSVVVLGANLASELFPGMDPVGQLVRINNMPFEVVGVLKTVGGFGFGGPDNQAFVPIPVAQGRLFNASRYRGDYVVSAISVQVVSEDRSEAAEREIEVTLRLRHGLKADEENDFSFFSQTSLLEMAADVSQTLTIFLGAIGAISLLVGGIGIMNIMLVSVTERTREIGIRRAVGAHDTDILMQFLIEALVLCGIGGLIGVGLSFGVAAVFGRMPSLGINVRIQADALILALGVSLASGLIFGIYPAMRATQLDPIEALRYE